MIIIIVSRPKPCWLFHQVDHFTGRKKRASADTGAVTLIQRFGSAANLNIHLHCRKNQGQTLSTR